MTFDTTALAKVFAQIGAMGAIVSLLVEQVRPFLSLRAVRLIVPLVSFAFVYIYKLDALATVGLQTPYTFASLIFNALLVAGAAKFTNDGLNVIDRTGDRRL